MHHRAPGAIQHSGSCELISPNGRPVVTNFAQVFMKSREKADYKKAFTLVKNLIARNGVEITKIDFITDDEPGMFMAFKQVFGDMVSLYLCAFHFLYYCGNG